MENIIFSSGRRLLGVWKRLRSDRFSYLLTQEILRQAVQTVNPATLASINFLTNSASFNFSGREVYLLQWFGRRSDPRFADKRWPSSPLSGPGL